MGSSFLKVIFVIFYITSEAHFISISTQAAAETVSGAPFTEIEDSVTAPTQLRKLLSSLCRQYDDKSGKIHVYPCGQTSTATYKEVSKGASEGKASGKEALAGPLRKDVLDSVTAATPLRKLLSALCRHYDKSGKIHVYPCGQASTATYKEVSKGASGGKALGKEALAGPLRKDVSGSREAGRLWGKSTSGHHQVSKRSEEPKI